MSSTIKVDTILDQAGSLVNPPSIPGLDKQLATAWVNFNGTGVVVIRDSFNVTSITDNGTGDYDVNFTTEMSNTDYVTVASVNQSSGNIGIAIASAQNTTDSRIVTSIGNPANLTDVSGVFVAFFGGV